MAMGVLILVILAPINLALRKRPEDIGLLPDGDSAAGAAAAARSSNVVDAAWTAIDWTLARAARTARFWWIASGYAAAMFAWYAVQVHQTKYLTEIGFTSSYAAWALGFVSLVAIPGQIALGHISDRIGREWVWTVGCLGFVVCYGALIVMGRVPSSALLWTMVIAQGFLGYALTSVIGAIPAEIFQGRHFGLILGTLMGLGVIGGAAGPWVTGLAYDLSGSYALAFGLAIALCCFSAMAIWLAGPRQIRAVAGRVSRVAELPAPTAAPQFGAKQ
jgi:MFS family permease